MLGNGSTERGQHEGSGDPVVGGHREGVAGAVVEPGQDLAVLPDPADPAVGATESVVGGVGPAGLGANSAWNRMEDDFGFFLGFGVTGR